MEKTELKLETIRKGTGAILISHHEAFSIDVIEHFKEYFNAELEDWRLGITELNPEGPVIILTSEESGGSVWDKFDGFLEKNIKVIALHCGSKPNHSVLSKFNFNMSLAALLQNITGKNQVVIPRFGK